MTVSSSTDTEKEDKKCPKSQLKKILHVLRSNAKSKQVLVGASAGFITGIVTTKIGKSAALALGGGMMLLQVLNEMEYININWDRVNDTVNNSVEENMANGAALYLKKVKEFVKNKNVCIMYGFVGGFLIGIAI
ncbi:FUN14 domain-containing protein 1A-like [Diabrotica virgifera virgifera]|uniref:FUN14 domain-containing protein 1-like n=1 Tax=Diabrotica virgifera virgifera TaxID=50390 RepID=A0ABM5ILI3_DIAVI|nr:FUN14 domain-containing protein 1A-like [Diabrotica virgifera virgifera]